MFFALFQLFGPIIFEEVVYLTNQQNFTKRTFPIASVKEVKQGLKKKEEQLPCQRDRKMHEH